MTETTLDPRVPVLLNTVRVLFDRYQQLAGKLVDKLDRAGQEQLVQQVTAIGDELKAMYGDLGALDTPDRAARLIAAALNAASEFDPWWDREDGRINLSRGSGDHFERADIYQDHTGTWQVGQ